MLDQGKDADWFSSSLIVILAIDSPPSALPPL